MDGVKATVASDIYALGVTLALILSDQKARPRRLEPARDTPAALWAIADKARHPERAGRYESATELARDVEDAIDDKPVKPYRDPWTTRARRWLDRNRHGRGCRASLLRDHRRERDGGGAGLGGAHLGGPPSGKSKGGGGGTLRLDGIE